MSTNFYVMPANVTDTDDPRAVHVLEQTAGGYTIRGHRDSPFGEVSSWARWREVLTALDGPWMLRDEYGTTVEPRDLVSEVDAVTMHERQAYVHSQLSWCNPGSSFRNRWTDAEGYLVAGYEFC